NRNPARLRQLDKNMRVRARELKTLRVDPQRDIGDLRIGRRIDHRQRSVAVADKYSIGPRIDADVVGIVAQINSADGRIGFASKQQDRPIAGVGDKQRLTRWQVADSLRLLHSGDAASNLARIQVHDADCIVLELRDEETLARQIDRQMVDPTIYLS